MRVHTNVRLVISRGKTAKQLIPSKLKVLLDFDLWLPHFPCMFAWMTALCGIDRFLSSPQRCMSFCSRRACLPKRKYACRICERQGIDSFPNLVNELSMLGGCKTQASLRGSPGCRFHRIPAYPHNIHEVRGSHRY